MEASTLTAVNAANYKNLTQPQKTAIKQERSRQIAAAYATGKSFGDIGLELGISSERVRQLLVAHEETTGEKITRHYGTPKLLARRAQVYAQFDEGKSFKQVARELGMSAHTVRNDILNDPDRAAEHKRRSAEQPHANSLYHEYHQEWADLYNNGRGMVSIAEEYGVPAMTVRRGLHAVGVESRPVGRRAVPQETKDAIVEAYLAGDTCSQVGKDFGVGAATVSNYVNMAGHELRKRGTSKLKARKS